MLDRLKEIAGCLFAIGAFCILVALLSVEVTVLSGSVILLVGVALYIVCALLENKGSL